MYVEIAPSLQALSQLLGLFLDCEVCTEHGQIHISCLQVEKVRPAEPMLDVIRWSSLHFMCNTFIAWCEGIAEIRVENPAIAVFVVSPDEEIDVISVRVRAKLSQRLYDFGNSDPSFAKLVEHLVSIHEIEVSLLSQAALCLVDFELKANVLAERRYQLLFLIEFQVMATSGNRACDPVSHLRPSGSMSAVIANTICSNISIGAGDGLERHLVNKVVLPMLLSC